MMDSFRVPYRGKLNRGVVVFYFKKKYEMDDFIENLREAMIENNVAGTVQWRRACKKYQQLKPELWKNAKTFIPESPKPFNLSGHDSFCVDIERQGHDQFCRFYLPLLCLPQGAEPVKEKEEKGFRGIPDSVLKKNQTRS